MGDRFLLTDEILATLRCSLCNCYLSVSPISIISEDATKYKCGRCHLIKTHIETRVTVYENLAKHMKFPCIYKDCDEKLRWVDVKEHEQICLHRTIICPKAGCYEELLYDGIVAHFKSKHKEAFHTDKFTLSNAHNYYNIDLLVRDGKAYIIIFDYDDVRYGISVCSLEPDKSQYEVVITSDNSKYSITCSEQTIVPFDKRIHCFKCVTGVCKNEAHVYRYYKKGILRKMTTRIDRDSVKRTFGSSVNYSISVIDIKPEGEEDIDDLIVKDMIIDEINDEEEEIEVAKEEEIIRRMLECPNCFEYMQPPIYQCVTGHTTCKKCKETLTKCPTCEAEIDNVRNLALEDAAKDLRLASLIAEKATNQVDATETTTVKEIVCPRVNCSESYDIKDIVTHFKEKHSNNFHWNTIKVTDVHSYFNIDVLARYGKAYIVLFDYNDQSLGISVCSIDEHDEDLFEARLASDDGKFCVTATDQKIVPFEELEHCSKCLSGTCQNTHHLYRTKRKTIFKRMTTKFNRDSVNRMFDYSILNYTINIIDGRKAFSRDFKLKKDRIFRKMYECPACKNYMAPPIQQCITGHSFCKPCVTDVEKCPLCEAQIKSTRNYIVEEMTEKVELPCRADPELCQFKASVKRMATHREECPVASKKPKVEKQVEAVENVVECEEEVLKTVEVAKDAVVADSAETGEAAKVST